MAVNLMNDIVCFCLVKNVNEIKNASISLAVLVIEQPGQVFDNTPYLLVK